MKACDWTAQMKKYFTHETGLVKKTSKTYSIVGIELFSSFDILSVCVCVYWAFFYFMYCSIEDREYGACKLTA